MIPTFDATEAIETLQACGETAWQLGLIEDGAGDVVYG